MASNAPSTNSPDPVEGVTDPVEENTKVKISVDSANATVQPLDAIGKVVRVTEESAECYLVGVNISDID